MAEGLFAHMVKGRGDFIVESAGISAMDGQKASGHTIEVLKKQKIDLSKFRSQALTRDLVNEATHIFCMTYGHREAIELLFPSAADKTFLVCEFCPDDDLMGEDVPDPIGSGRGAYEETFDTLKRALPSVLGYIDTTWKNSPTPDTAPMPPDTTSSPSSKRIIAGADHGGWKLKDALVAHLRGKGFIVEDIGTNSGDRVDYPDYSDRVSRAVLQGDADAGLLVCTTGIGMSIGANRHSGIQAALLHTVHEAEMTRRHNNANVMTFAGATDERLAKEIVDKFLSTEFEGGRHGCRVDKMNAGVSVTDPAVAVAIRREEHRQQNNIELIASENFTSRAVREAQGSVLTNKYAEGYPGKRWYGGCENVDVVEQLAIDRAKELFGCDHVNVQPHSGSQANAAVYFSMLEFGDPILAMNLAHGGHLTHGNPANFSGKFYTIHAYGVSEKDGRIDYDELAAKAAVVKPKMITAGASAYPRTIDFPRMAEIAKSVGALLFVDMAHIAGLVAGGAHPTPVPYADFVTTTTHKSLRGPRGGIIMCRAEHAKKIDSMVFPGTQGGPLMHVIAGKAICLGEALRPEFKDYQQRVVKNAAALAAALTELGYQIASGGTDNHLMLVDLRPRGLDGKIASETLDEAGITVNKNSIPFDTAGPFKPSGIRLGTPAVTTRGMNEPEMKQIASLLHEALTNRDSKEKLHAIRARVVELNQRFPLP